MTVIFLGIFWEPLHCMRSIGFHSNYILCKPIARFGEYLGFRPNSLGKKAAASARPNPDYHPPPALPSLPAVFAPYPHS